MNLRELFTPAAVAANFTEVYSNQQPYLGAGLFPAKKKAGLDLSWIKGSKGLPVSLSPSAFDAKAKFRDRIGVSKVETEMPFFREGYLIKEKDRQELLRAASTADPYAMAVIEHIFDDARNLLEGAAVVPERMIWQLLAPENGKPGISIAAGGMDYTYNYDKDGAFQGKNYTALTTGKWNDAEACDPIGDIQTTMLALQERTGVIPAIAVMNRKTFNYLLKAKSVKSAVLAQNASANVVMTDRVVKDLFLALLGVTIVVYTKMYKKEDGTAAQFYPDNLVSLLPAGALGSTWYGTTPEEADLMGADGAEVSIVNTGVAITRIITPHPVNIELYASEIVLPSFERMDEVAVLKVI